MLKIAGRLSVTRANKLSVSLFLWIIAFVPQLWAQTVRVDTTPDHIANSFRPTEALGAGVDRIPRASTDKVFSEPMIKQILAAGWQPVTYRQNTELYVEAWHWNPQGKWSDAGNQGYFVGNSTPTEFIRHSQGYPLTHPGFSQPDGTGYSRLTDGDLNTYWKSNPYLTKTFTGEDDSLHPQWVVVDLATRSKSMQFVFIGRHRMRVITWCSIGRVRMRFTKRRRAHGLRFPAAILGTVREPGYASAFACSDFYAVHPHLDDRVFQHLRHAWIDGSPQLSWLRDQRGLSRDNDR
jgi:hypothetical protein